LKIFFGVWLVRKNQHQRKTESDNRQWNLAMSSRHRQIPANLVCRNSAKSSNSGKNFQILAKLVEIWTKLLKSDCTGRISAVLVRFRSNSSQNLICRNPAKSLNSGRNFHISASLARIWSSEIRRSHRIMVIQY